MSVIVVATMSAASTRHLLEIGFALARGLLDAKLEAAIGALLCSTTATRCAAARNAIALQFQKSKRFRNATSTALASADKAPP